MKEGFIRIKVKPQGKMVMVSVVKLADKIGSIDIASEMQTGDILRRAKVLAVGSDCVLTKPGDTVYLDLRANTVQVEGFAASLNNSEVQTYLVFEDNIPAHYSITEEDAEDVVVGMDDKKAKAEVMAKVESSMNAAQEAFNNLNRQSRILVPKC